MRTRLPGAPPRRARPFGQAARPGLRRPAGSLTSTHCASRPGSGGRTCRRADRHCCRSARATGAPPEEPAMALRRAAPPPPPGMRRPAGISPGASGGAQGHGLPALGGRSLARGASACCRKPGGPLAQGLFWWGRPGKAPLRTVQARAAFGGEGAARTGPGRGLREGRTSWCPLWGSPETALRSAASPGRAKSRSLLESPPGLPLFG